MTLQIKNLLVRIIRRAFDLLLKATDLSSRAVKWVKPRKAHPAFNPGDHSREGITVIIPERDSPEMLADCLKAAAGALALVDAPGEIVVVANGADPGRYETVKKSFPRVRWEHFIQPLGFGAAIRRGLDAANYSWVYLLNSDMLLDRRALIELWPFRGDDVFALASQIFFQDPEKRREETGFTALRVANGEIELFDAEPLDPDLVCDHLYAGGGSSLFQRGPLTRYVENAHVYAPFYWEDVEWGVRARRDGLEVLFVPKSHAWHKHRATVSRFYSPEEVREIFEVNSWQCLVRNRLAHGKSQPLPWVRSVTGKQVWGMVKSRWLLWQSGWPERPRGENAVSYYPARPAPDDPRPWMIIATPFALFPTRHGGAVRMMNLSRFLSNHFRLALLSDEADLYPVDRLKELTRFQRVHLIKGRPETSTRPPARMARMRSHAHSLMRRELSRMIANLKPAIVQIEYSELAGLVRSRDGGSKWFITLHDVLTGMGERWRAISELYEKRLLKRYDGVICCSGDDYDLLPIQNKILVDNGVSLGSFDYAPSTSTPVILFMGPFRYAPNREGILWFVRRVFPDLKKRIPALALRVLAAKNPMEVREKWPGLDRDGVEILDFTEDIRIELANASVTINPMKNIRGSSIKVIESLASGRICVTTADGARGYSAAGFKALRIADSGEEFIRELGRLLTDHDLRRGLESPDLNALESYDWKNLAQKQRGFYSAARFPGRR